MIMIIVVIMIIITMKIHYVILKVKISFVAVNRGYVSYTRSSVSSKLYVRSLVNYTPIQEQYPNGNFTLKELTLAYFLTSFTFQYFQLIIYNCNRFSTLTRCTSQRAFIRINHSITSTYRFQQKKAWVVTSFLDATCCRKD